MIKQHALQAIHEFWFGPEVLDARVVSKRQSSLWWSKSAAVDAQIRERFEPMLQQELQGQFAEQQTPSDMLARIILLDQFPRNMYREQAQAFAYDERARLLASQLCQGEGERRLTLIERGFVYLPFEHSEHFDDQLVSENFFQQLVDEACDEEKELFSGFLRFAVRHREIIEQFDRFPHRNAWLGRESTEQELAFLQTPGSGF